MLADVDTQQYSPELRGSTKPVIMRLWVAFLTAIITGNSCLCSKSPTHAVQKSYGMGPKIFIESHPALRLRS